MSARGPIADAVIRMLEDANGDGQGIIRREGDQIVMAEMKGPGAGVPSNLEDEPAKSPAPLNLRQRRPEATGAEAKRP